MDENDPEKTSETEQQKQELNSSFIIGSSDQQKWFKGGIQPEVFLTRQEHSDTLRLL